MYLNLGAKIKELRLKNGQTQEALANAFVITSQAVSRWESGESYPGVDIIPIIANYFGITIDELFGYNNNRDTIVKNIIDKVNSFNIKARSDSDWIDECLQVLREGIAEFPKNEDLLITLAETLCEAGYRKFCEHSYYDEQGIRKHNYTEHNKNKYWQEAIKISENLLDAPINQNIINRSISLLVLLYKNIGNFNTSIKYANKQTDLSMSKELMLITATDGLEQSKYIGEYLMKSVHEISHQIIYNLMNNLSNFDTEIPIKKIQGIIDLYNLIFDDGNMGIYHGDLIKYYLYLSKLQYEKGYEDDAFDSLDEALINAKKLESFSVGNHKYTSSLLKECTFTINEKINASKLLPEDWPWWNLPFNENVTLKIKSDKRYQDWILKCNE